MERQNGYHESIKSKVFKRISKSNNFSHLQQQMLDTDIEEEEIRMK